MDLQAIPPRPSSPSPARSLLRLIHDRNPFHLLSALSMFVGYRLVLGALDSPAGDGRTLLGLIVVMQAYEAVLIALALFLIVRRGLVRDGWILLGIESLFLVDLTNLNAELFTAWPVFGAVVSVVCFGLAVLKIGVVVRTLRLQMTLGTAGYVVAQLAVLLAMPGAFRLMRSAGAAVSPAQVYAAWWGVAILLAVGGRLVRRDPRTDGHPMAALPIRLFVLVPLASVLVHLASENRVYWVHFQPANVAPVLLAVIVAVNRGRPTWLQLRWSVALAAVALFASAVSDPDGTPVLGSIGDALVTPLRLTLLPAFTVLAWVAVRHRSWQLALGLAAGVGVAVIYVAWWAVVRHLVRLAEWAWELLARLVPQTPLQWGYAAIIAAFVLLGVGAIVSLRPGGRPTVDVEPA